jgi:tryptophanyl-tRNA synthetase
MSKSSAAAAGTLLLSDEPDVLRRKVMRAVTDSEAEVRYDPAGKPGVSNLLDILAACAGGDPRALATEFGRYGDLKAAVADAVVATLAPIRARAAELESDPGHLRAVLREGAERAREVAAAKVVQVKQAIGLLEG